VYFTEVLNCSGHCIGTLETATDYEIVLEKKLKNKYPKTHQLLTLGRTTHLLLFSRTYIMERDALSEKRKE
jgi:hypothetical protein